MKGPPVDPGSVARSERPSSISTSLLLRVQAADADAWQRLVRLCGPVVYSWCRRAGLRPEDAADVGQEVFMAVAQGIAGFRRERPGDSFRGWLWTITQNKVTDWRRRHTIEPVAQGGSSNREWIARVPAHEELDPSSSDAPAACMSEGMRRALSLVRDDFEERTWQAFWAVIVDDRTPASVAADLNMSTGAVYIAKSRVLRRLRDEFGDLVL